MTEVLSIGIYLMIYVAIRSIARTILFLFLNMHSKHLLVTELLKNMGRGVSSGGGQSSLDYLFGSGEAPKPRTNNVQAAPKEVHAVSEPTPKPTASPPPPKPEPVDITKQIPAGIHSTSTNNYLRADGQNTGNFITVYFSNLVFSIFLEMFIPFFFIQSNILFSCLFNFSHRDIT